MRSSLKKHADGQGHSPFASEEEGKEVFRLYNSRLGTPKFKKNLDGGDTGPAHIQQMKELMAEARQRLEETKAKAKASIASSNGSISIDVKNVDIDVDKTKEGVVVRIDATGHPKKKRNRNKKNKENKENKEPAANGGSSGGGEEKQKPKKEQHPPAPKQEEKKKKEQPPKAGGGGEEKKKKNKQKGQPPKGGGGGGEEKKEKKDEKKTEKKKKNKGIHPDNGIKLTELTHAYKNEQEFKAIQGNIKTAATVQDFISGKGTIPYKMANALAALCLAIRMEADEQGQIMLIESGGAVVYSALGMGNVKQFHEFRELGQNKNLNEHIGNWEDADEKTAEDVMQSKTHVAIKARVLIIAATPLVNHTPGAVFLKQLSAAVEASRIDFKVTAVWVMPNKNDITGNDVTNNAWRLPYFTKPRPGQDDTSTLYKTLCQTKRPADQRFLFRVEINGFNCMALVHIKAVNEDQERQDPDNVEGVFQRLVRIKHFLQSTLEIDKKPADMYYLGGDGEWIIEPTPNDVTTDAQVTRLTDEQRLKKKEESEAKRAAAKAKRLQTTDEKAAKVNEDVAGLVNGETALRGAVKVANAKSSFVASKPDVRVTTRKSRVAGRNPMTAFVNTGGSLVADLEATDKDLQKALQHSRRQQQKKNRSPKQNNDDDE